MKLDELEKECGKKTTPIPDTCQRQVNLPIMPTLPCPTHRTINRIPQDASKQELRSQTDGLCKVTRFIPDQTYPSGFRREDSYEHVDLDMHVMTAETKKSKQSPDAHLGGVELDTVNLRYAFPYSEEFTHEDWEGIS